MRPRELILRVRLSRDMARSLLGVFLLLGTAGDLSPGQLDWTTYYPDPSATFMKLVSRNTTRLAETSGNVTLAPGQDCHYNPALAPVQPQYTDNPYLPCASGAHLVRIDDRKAGRVPRTKNNDGSTFLPTLYVRGNIQADRLVWADQAITEWPAEIGGYKIEGCTVVNETCAIKKNIPLVITWTIFDSVILKRIEKAKDKFGNEIVYNVWGSKFQTKIWADQGLFPPLNYLPMNPEFKVLSPQGASGIKTWTQPASGMKPSVDCSYTATIGSADLKGSCKFVFPRDDGNPVFKFSVEIE